MLKAKRRVNALLWVVVGIILLVGIIFASVFFYSQFIAVPVYKTAVDVKKVTITKGDNIESVTVTTNGETIKSGDLVPVGATLTISATATSGYIASWTVTNGITTESANATSVTVKGDVTVDAKGLLYVFGQYTSGTFANFYYVDMGTYPQSKVTNVTADTLTDAYKTTKSYSLKSTNDCPVYEYNGVEYIKYNTSTSDTTQVVYKVEPVRWLILGKVTGGQTSGEQTTEAVTSADFTTVNGTLTYTGDVENLLVLSEKVLIQQVFDDRDALHSKTNSYNDWKNSTIHTFMNGTLKNDLFTTDEQGYLTPQTLRTSYYSGGKKTGADADTSYGDKLFLLSCTYSSKSYGTTDSFILQQTLKVGATASNVDCGSTQTILKAKGTGLAFATGCDNSSNYTRWWLRAGYYAYDYKAFHVDYSGRVDGIDVSSSSVGVRPAFVLNIA